MAELSPLGTVLITGGRGNLGHKLAAHLLSTGRSRRVVCLDRPGAPLLPPQEGLAQVDLDLGSPGPDALRRALEGVDAVVHLAASPSPETPWDVSAVSFEMTLRLAQLAASCGVRRLVFASSNHAMGRYKDPPFADRVGPGELGPGTPRAPGTLFRKETGLFDGIAYGATKLLGEHACSIAAETSGGRLTSVSVRIGWCQGGENRPETISAEGGAKDRGAVDPAEEARALRWFRNMWLSNRDFLQVMERALLADASGWPAPGIVVNGMSANRGMAWDLETGRRLIGYEPQDDIWRELGLAPA